MASNLTIVEAQEQIEQIVGDKTNDFELILAKRKMNTRLDKRVTFCIKVKKEDISGEELFDSLQTLTIKNPDFVDVASDLIRENTVLKELYFISAIVAIKDI